VTPEKAIKLAVNDTGRALMAKKLGTPSTDLPPLYGMLCGAIAGFCQVIATNPMEIVKIQLQLAATNGGTGNFRLSDVVRSLGLRGLYRGTVSTLCRDIPFSILFFQSFASLRSFFRDPHDLGPQLSKSLLAGMIAGGASSVAVTPMDGTT
jgi:hypothetical protein